jgi:hypothetical protein
MAQHLSGKTEVRRSKAMLSPLLRKLLKRKS